MTASTPSRVPITQGSVSREIRAPGVTLTETVHRRGLELPEHHHPEATLTLVLAGGFEERFGGSRFGLGPLEALYKPAETSHSNRYGPGGARSLLVSLDRETHRRLERLATDPARDPVAVDGAGAARALALYAADASVETSLGWEELFAGLLERTGGRLGCESRRPAWLGRVEERVRERFAEPLRLGLLAEEVEVHPVHLARVYRRFHGHSVGDAIRRRRVEHAVERLLGATAAVEGRRRSDAPTDLACLALECGFADQSHLTRAFRREIGIPPVRFRCRALSHLG